MLRSALLDVDVLDSDLESNKIITFNFVAASHA